MAAGRLNQIGTHALRLRILIAALLLLAPVRAVAHPHVWVDAASEMAAMVLSSRCPRIIGPHEPT